MGESTRTLEEQPTLPAETRERVLSGARIRLRLIAFSVLLVAALTALVFALVTQIFDELTPALRHDLRWKVQRGVAELSRTAEFGVLLKDRTLVEHAVTDYLRDRDIIGLVALDDADTVVLRHATQPLPQDLFAGPAGVVRDDARSMHAWAPIRIESATVGRVALVVSTERLRAGDALRRNILRAAGLGALVALLASIAFVAFYVGPILTLTRAAFLRLERTTQAALEASRVKSEFLANMSHEVRTPLHGIIGMLSLLLRTDLVKKQRRYAELSYASATSLLTIVNDVLDFSKLEAGRVQIRYVDCDVRTLMQEVIEPLVAPAQERGIELLYTIRPEVPQWVSMDGDRVRQVITNLLSNAVKFTERGEVVLKLELRAREGDRVRLCWAVRDTGIGIARDDQERLFQSFAQIDGSLTRRHGGTGLGLAISKHLVERMGGRIGVTSEVGTGSTFWFEIEARELAPADVEPVTTTVLQRHVLLVSTNETYRALLAEQMRNWGMRVESVAQPNEARAAVRHAREHNAPFDAIVVDVGVALDERGVNAVDATLAELRDGLSAEALPIALLAPVMHTLTNVERRLGVTLLPKPVRVSELYNAFIEMFGEPRAPSEEPAAPLRRGATPARRGRVLVVEDNVLNREVVAELLDRFGYDFETAENGRAALAALEASRFDAILMDCQMPVMDGYEATRRIRVMEGSASHTPIIALTAHALAEERERASSAGMDAYLTKPISERALVDTLRRWTSHPEASTPEKTHATSAPSSSTRAVEAAPLLQDKPRSDKVIRLFLEHTPKQLAQLRDEPDLVREHAHKLKGSCGAIGAPRMMAACASLEERARAGRDLDVGREAKRLVQLFEETADVLRGQLREETARA